MADRLTDAELLRLHTSFCQFSPNATDKALTELIERRAMDAEVLKALSWALARLWEPSKSVRDACNPYCEGWDQAKATLSKLKESA